MLNLQCTKKEWYLAKSYSNLDRIGNGLSELKQKYKHLYMKPVYLIGGLLGLTVVLAISSNIFSFIDKASGVFVFLIFLGLIVGAIWLRHDYNEYKNKLNDILKPPENDDVILYTLSNDGIMINFYNVLDHQYIIHWEDISNVRVVNMSIEPIYKEGELQLEEMQEKLNQKFEEAKSVVADFDYEAKLTHDDMYSLRIMTKNSVVVLLPIPPSWENNETQIADKFIKFIEKEVNGDFTAEEKQTQSIVDRFMNLQVN